jgi:hypothetical protein
MLLPSLYISSALVFSMFGIHTPAGLTLFALLYGFWSGSCKSALMPKNLPLFRLLSFDCLDVSLIPSLLVQLSSGPEELGYVQSYFRHLLTSFMQLPQALGWG